MTTTVSKLCPRCKDVKPPELFSKNKRTKDGLSCYCKVCISSIFKETYEKNKKCGPVNVPTEQTCTLCKRLLPITAFTKSHSYSTGYYVECKPCRYDSQKKWKEKNPDKVKIRYERDTLKRKQNKTKTRKIMQASYERRRLRVLNHYSQGAMQCQCCGESNYEFLVLDHKNGGGNKQLRELGSSRNIYLWVIRNKFPEGFRILCHNCNASHGSFHYCPHKTQSKFTKSYMDQALNEAKKADESKKLYEEHKTYKRGKHADGIKHNG